MTNIGEDTGCTYNNYGAGVLCYNLTGNFLVYLIKATIVEEGRVGDYGLFTVTSFMKE